jgi:transmembrane sensor
MIGDSIRYLDGSSVIDEQMKRQASGRAPTRLLMLSTPKGGTYQVTLSDGTQVWLNAASTLRYPEQFTGDERTVEIEGEAYFSVTKDARRPFRVNSRDQRVLVLGTEFNISAYVDDAEVKTTLVEGVVQLRAESTGEHTDLFAGQQGFTRKGNIRKRSVDPTSSVAWKNGDFYFDNTPLVEMMKQIERWYDVEVIYENTVPPERFSGGMSRGVTLQTVLQLLKVSEIKYSISDKKLIIE